MVTISRRHFLEGAVAAPFVLGASRSLAEGDNRPNFTVAVADLPATLEPARELSNVGTRVTYSIFDTLIRRDFLGSPDGGGSELKPHLATSWERIAAGAGGHPAPGCEVPQRRRTHRRRRGLYVP